VFRRGAVVSLQQHARVVGGRFMADVGGITPDQLKSYIERIEKLEEEKAALQADIKEVYNEAKANGFDSKIMRQVIGLRKKDKNDLRAQEQLLDLYKRALGMDDG
jgi:uncharacterized protein (UPF0335 family)